jgi:glycosyltransferase involved in cell wall biosynthesis
MKIAHLIKDLDVGGIQSLLLDIIDYYEEKKQDYILIVIGEGQWKNKFEKYSDKCFFIKKELPFIDPFLINKVKYLIKKQRIDIIHAHHVSEGITAFFATKGTKIKTVQSFHASPKISNSQDNFVFRQLAKKMDACVVPSAAQLSELEKAGYDVAKLEVINNALNPKRLFEGKTYNIKEKLGLQQQHLVLGMIGNFYTNTRDQITICKALPIVMRKFPDVRFVFFGGYKNNHVNNHEKYNTCLEICKNNGILDKVFFFGQESNHHAMLSSLDYFVYSSLNDTFGIAVAEAMHWGIPMIINDIAVLREVVGKDEHAFFFTTADEVSLAEKLTEALENPEKLREMANKAQIHAQSNYHIEKHVEELNRLYHKVLAD